MAAVIIGSQVEHLIPLVQEYGAEKIYVADEERLKLYESQHYAAIFQKLIEQEDPHILLVGATAIGSQLAPTIAGKVKTGVAAHSVELKIDEKDKLVAVVPAFGGKVLGDILCPNRRPQMASIKPGILDKPEKKKVETEIIKVDLNFLNQVKTNLKPLNPPTGRTQRSTLRRSRHSSLWRLGDR